MVPKSLLQSFEENIDIDPIAVADHPEPPSQVARRIVFGIPKPIESAPLTEDAERAADHVSEYFWAMVLGGYNVSAGSGAV